MGAGIEALSTRRRAGRYLEDGMTNELRKLCFFGLAGCLVWLILGFVFWKCPSLLVEGQGWWETLNGATWPTGWQKALWEPCPICFDLVVAGRTTLNLAGPLALVASAVYFSALLERRMQMALSEILRVHDTEVIGQVILAIETKLGVTLSDVDRAWVRERGMSVQSTWLNEVDVKKDSDEARKGV